MCVRQGRLVRIGKSRGDKGQNRLLRQGLRHTARGTGAWQPKLGSPAVETRNPSQQAAIRGSEVDSEPRLNSRCEVIEFRKP